jgi:hypothetical protein
MTTLVKFAIAQIHDRAATIRVRARRDALLQSLAVGLGSTYADLDRERRSKVDRAAELIAVAECSRRAVAAGTPTEADHRSLERLEAFSRKAVAELGLPGHGEVTAA